MAFRAFYIKNGRLRLYSGTTGGGPFFFEVPFRGTIQAPVDRPRPAETMILDRGRLTSDAHYILGDDSVIVAPLQFTCSFRLGSAEPNFSKLLTAIRGPANTGMAAPTKTIGGRSWASTKGTSSFYNADMSGAAQSLITTPAFADYQKWTCDLEALWEDVDNVNDRGFQWKEVYFPPDRQITEGDQDLMCDLSGEVYGAINLITAFTAGTES